MARKLKPETRAKRLVEKVPADKQEQAMQLALNLIFMEEKLDETRERIKDQPTAIPYDNGGGQCGVRVNPEYQAYEALLKSYGATLKQFGEMFRTGSVERSNSVSEFRSKQSFNIPRGDE